MAADKLKCGEHGEAFETFVCEHLVTAGSSVDWYSLKPDAQNHWPDVWCGECQKEFEKEGGWNRASEGQIKIKLLCHMCYESSKARCAVHYIEDGQG